MTTLTETTIRARARRAYEFSRAGNALALGLLVAAPAMMVSMDCCATPLASVLCGVALGATVAAARFVGLKAQSALRPGLVAGLLAFSFPVACSLFMCPSGMCMQGGMEWIPYVAISAAFLGGIAMKVFSRGGLPLVAGSTALLFGSLGSLVVGPEGPLLTAAGLAIGSAVTAQAFRRGGSA